MVLRLLSVCFFENRSSSSNLLIEAFLECKTFLPGWEGELFTLASCIYVVVTMATCFLVVLVFILFHLGGISIPDKRKEALLTINPY